jgi:hypothetical protein
MSMPKITNDSVENISTGQPGATGYPQPAGTTDGNCGATRATAKLQADDDAAALLNCRPDERSGGLCQNEVS